MRAGRSSVVGRKKPVSVRRDQKDPGRRVGDRPLVYEPDTIDSVIGVPRLVERAKVHRLAVEDVQRGGEKVGPEVAEQSERMLGVEMAVRGAICGSVRATPSLLLITNPS
jgi:hypothetical protein